MAGINFFQAPPDPAADPQGFSRARDMAALLMKQGAAPQQGQMAGQHYVAPSPYAYAAQLASGLAGGYKSRQLAEAQRASTILNGGGM